MSAYRSSDDGAATVRFRFECPYLAVSSNKEEDDKDDSIICKTEKAAIEEEEDRVTRTFLPMAGGWYDCNGLRS
jgi:hypothetical protein